MGRKKSENRKPPPSWIELPRDVTANILLRLGAEEVLRSAQNQAISNVSRLNRYGISGEYLVEAVKKLPQLEELHLTVADHVLADEVETIGISCPTLKSFSYNERGSKIPKELKDDDFHDEFDVNQYSLAIGKSMPNLRYLQLFASSMRNEGLEVILDGCPHLESLDIRQCFGLDLEGDLGKRCREQIKDLKLPSDSINDVSWLLGETSEWDPYETFNSGCGFSEYDYYYDEYETDDDYVSPFNLEFR